MSQRQNGSFYIVEELLAGDNLRVHLARRGRFPFDEALEILLPVMDALIHAHDQGIVHRDLKPENIMLTPTRPGELRPKFIDFGIAQGNATDGGQKLT